MKNKTLLILSGALLLWFILNSFLLQLPLMSSNKQFIPPDALSYVQAGDFWLNNSASAIRPYGYSLLTAFTGAGDSGEISVLLLVVQVFCWLLTCLLIHLAASEFLKGWIKYVPLALFAISPSNIIFTWLTLSETLFAFLLILVGFLLLQYVKNSENKALLVCINVLLAFACVVRPIVQLPLLFTITWTIYECLKSRPLKLTTAFLSLILVLGVLGLQLARMKREFGTYTISHIGNMAWYQYIGTVSESLAKGEDVKKTREKRDSAEIIYLANNTLVSDIWKRKDELYASDFKNQWRDHKNLIFKAWGLNMLQNTSAPSAMIPKLKQNNAGRLRVLLYTAYYKLTSWINILISLLLLPLAVAGAVYMWFRERKWIPETYTLILVFTSFLALFLLLTSGMSMWQGDRFSMVYYPLVLFSLSLLLGKFRSELK